ncbi:PALP domain-containing protein [Marisediminicola senii]|uniref:hypothetical protein n=1 Tax=Marisediminicola senii TaxID=2711233 RepID=UPI0013ED0D78|nr:hypothetical protein [Marisediminicola senii]
MRTRATSIALAAILVTGLTGCTFGAVQANRIAYDPSDGFGTTVGDVEVRNAILISEDGETANFVANFINSGNQNVPLVVSWETASGQVDRNVYLRGGGTLAYGTGSSTITMSGIDAPLGSLFPVFFQYGDEPGEELLVPVLDGGLEEYSDLVPDSTSASE